MATSNEKEAKDDHKIDVRKVTLGQDIFADVNALHSVVDRLTMQVQEKREEAENYKRAYEQIFENAPSQQRKKKWDQEYTQTELDP